MNRRAIVCATLPLAICAVMLAPIAQGACEPKEYAEYKDEAKSIPGQMGLAYDHCIAQTSWESAKKEADLAIQYRMIRDADQAMATMKACSAERSKISNALTAAKAYKALEFANGGCQGGYPMSKKEARPPSPLYKCETDQGVIRYTEERCETKGMKTIRVISE